MTIEELYDFIKLKFEAQDGRFDRLEGRVGGLEDKVGGLEGRIESLEDKVGGLEGEVKSLRTDMNNEFWAVRTELDTAFKHLDNKIDILSGRIGYNADVARMSDDLHAVQTVVRNHSDQINKLNKAVGL